MESFRCQIAHSPCRCVEGPKKKKGDKDKEEDEALREYSYQIDIKSRGSMVSLCCLASYPSQEMTAADVSS